MDGPVGIASPPSTWTLDAAYAYATKRAVAPADPDGEPLYNCPFPQCAKQFSKRFNLKAHLRVHTGDKPFACNFQGCTRRFMWKSSLTSHQAGHSRRKQELQKRNAVMAGKALAAESVQNAANMAMRSSSTYGHYPDQYNHQQHTQQHHIHPAQPHPQQSQQHYRQLQQQRHQQQPAHFHNQQQHQQQQQQHQARPHPHVQQHLPTHAAAPSLQQHPQAMYGNTATQPRNPSHPIESRRVPVSQQQISPPSSSAPFGHHRPAEPSPALSYITTEDAHNSPASLRPAVAQSHPQHQLQRQQQEQRQMQHHQPPLPHQQQKPHKRPSDPFFDSRQQQEQAQPSKQPRHHADTSVQRPSPPRVEAQSSQRTSFASQQSFNHEPPSGYFTAQQPQSQQQPQFIRQERAETKALAVQRADQQKLLQDECQQLERQEQQRKEQQRLLRQKQEHNEEEQRRLQQLQEQQERHRRELEQRQSSLAQSGPQSGPQQTTPTVSESLLSRPPSATVEHRQDTHISFQKLEDNSRGLRPSQRTPMPSLTPTLTPLGGTGRSDSGVQLKSDPPSALPKPSPPMLASPALLGLSTGSILPSPTASMGMTRSPNGFSQQFLFPSQVTSPTWATTPTVLPVSMTLASPKAPHTPNSLMDVQMASLHSDHHAGDMSPVPSEVAVSPGIAHSPVPPPILPQVSAQTSRHRRPLNHAKPPLAGPSLSSGPSALLPPLTNVAPANPPTHIDLRGVLEEEGPNCSLPALGSPHTDMSPLPVASPIFRDGQTPISPMQPFSPFSGMMNSISARGKQTTTW